MLDTYKKKASELRYQYRSADEQVKKEEQEFDRIQVDLESTIEAQEIVQGIAQTIQQKAHEQISSVVTRCLNAVFEDAYDFRIKFERKRGKTEAKLVFSRDGVEFDDPLNEIGGGVIDVAALALRLSCILLSRPYKRRFVVLDEPFKNIRGLDNKERTRKMLLKLAEELKIQFVINTEIESFQLGTVIELS